MKTLLTASLIGLSGMVGCLSVTLWKEFQTKRKKQQKQQEVQDRMEILDELEKGEEEESLDEEDFNETEVEKSEINDSINAGSVDSANERDGSSNVADNY